MTSSEDDPRKNVKPGDDGPAAFFDFVRKRLLCVNADLFGFGSICSSYPLTLRLAEQVKRGKDGVGVVLGGPQASVVDQATLKAFPFVDYIVRGEADITFPRLVKALSTNTSAADFERHPGITYRHGNTIVRNPNAPVIEDLDALPLPAFDLDPYVSERGGLHLEAGRGCPFACTFCSTNDFFRRNYRLKSPQKLIGEMRCLQRRYDTRAFTLVHDMFTVDRKKVELFCEALLELDEKFSWSCSARTDCVTEDLLALMARAGCEGIFFGIETGSPRLQKVVRKNLDLEEAWANIKSACGHGMTTAVALITAFPDENQDDLRATAHFFVNSLRLDNAEPQLSLLAPLAETPIAREYWENLVFDGSFSDMSHQGWRQDPDDLSLIRRHKDVFINFYSIPTRGLSRQYFVGMRDFLMGLDTWLRWLPVAILDATGDLIDVFDQWRDWRSTRGTTVDHPRSSFAPYYCRSSFQTDFAEFVRERCLPCDPVASLAIGAIADVESSSKTPLKTETDLQRITLDEVSESDTPELTSTVKFVGLAVDYLEVLARLRQSQELSGLVAKQTGVLLVERRPEEVEVCNVDSLQGMILRSCKEGCSLGTIVDRVSSIGATVAGVSGRRLALGCLAVLEARGMVKWMRPNRTAEDGESVRVAHV